MNGTLKGLLTASCLALFGTSTATAQVCPPMPDCEAVYVACVEATGDADTCYRTILLPCIADMCSGSPGDPGIPPV